MKKRGYTVQDIVRLIPTYISEWVSDLGDVALIGGLTAPCGRPGYYTELTIDALIAEESKRKLDYWPYIKLPTMRLSDSTSKRRPDVEDVVKSELSELSEDHSRAREHLI